MTVAAVEGGAIEGRIVSSTEYQAAGGGQGSGTYTTYNTRTVGGSEAPTGTKNANRAANMLSNLTQQQVANVSVPKGFPAFMGSRPLLFWSWAAAMAVITWDEWNTNHILPRPARYWGATWVWVGLGIVSLADALVPVANALGVGYAIALAYQFFNGQGQFAAGGGIEGTVPGGSSALTGAPSAPSGIRGVPARPGVAPGQITGVIH